MKKLFSIAFAIMMIAACSGTPKGTYIIHGTVTSPDLEGAQIFLVPLENASKETIDSVVIKNQTFEFTGTEEKIADLRIEKMKRIGTENLLVVTEPGDIYVSIGQVSTGMGTIQNDSLQVWKNLTMEYNTISNEFLRQGNREAVTNLHASYKARSKEIAKNVGENTTLGKFISSLFSD